MGLFNFFKRNTNNEPIKIYGDDKMNSYSEDELSNNFNDAIDSYESSETFEMRVDAVFTISSRGTVATGKVSKGSAIVGDEVFINNDSKKYKIVGIEMFKKRVPAMAAVGDNVGLVLGGLNKSDVSVGDLIHK